MIPRILWHMGAGILKRKLSPQEPGSLLRYSGVWKSRASLKDCNFGSKLVENAYFRNMELAICLQGILHACARNRWYFVFGSQGLRHYKDIGLYQPYEVHTRNIYWDDNWFFLLAQFRCPDTGDVFAEGISRVMLRHGRERVDSRILYEEMGVHGLTDPPQPEIIKQFLMWDAASEQSMKATTDANAITFADRKRPPPVMSAYSMNLPFGVPQMKQD